MPLPLEAQYKLLDAIIDAEKTYALPRRHAFTKHQNILRSTTEDIERHTVVGFRGPLKNHLILANSSSAPRISLCNIHFGT